MKFFVKVIISGIEMGEIELGPEDTLEIVPVDCFLGYTKSNFTEEKNGMATDGCCIRAYKDLDEVIDAPHDNFPPAKSDVVSIPTTNLNGPTIPANGPTIQVPNGPTIPETNGPTIPNGPTIQEKVSKNNELKKMLVEGILVPASEVRSTRGKDGRNKEEKVSPTPPLKEEITLQQKTKKEKTKKVSARAGEQDIINSEVGAAASNRKKPLVDLPKEIFFASQGGQIPKSMIDYAKKILGDMPESAIRILLENFCDYYLRLGKKWADWNAAWRSWIRKEKEFQKKRSPEYPGLKAPRLITEADQEELLRD